MIDGIKSHFDVYTFQARILPSLIVVLPLGVMFAALDQSGSWKEGIISGSVVSILLTALLAQFGRDAGRRKEHELFNMWGGVVTTNMLSFCKSSINSQTIERYHKKLKDLIPEITIPMTREEEQNDLDTALTAYESCVDFLREATRDKDKFRLVFAENVNYGFRRNLWGWKPFGILAFIISAISQVWILANFFLRNETPSLRVIAALGVTVCLGSAWTFIIKPKWIYLAAKAYAERLLNALEKL